MFKVDDIVVLNYVKPAPDSGIVVENAGDGMFYVKWNKDGKVDLIEGKLLARAVNYGKDESKTHSVTFLLDDSVNNGGSTDYYKLPTWATELQHLIEHKNMNFALGNVFKACYRLGEAPHSEAIRDLNKMIWFATMEKERLERVQQRKTETS